MPDRGHGYQHDCLTAGPTDWFWSVTNAVPLPGYRAPAIPSPAKPSGGAVVVCLAGNDGVAIPQVTHLFTRQLTALAPR